MQAHTTTRRRKVTVRVWRGRTLLRGAACILTFALCLRLLFLSGLGGKAEALIAQAGENTGFVHAVLGLELPASSGEGVGWDDFFAAQSAALMLPDTPAETEPPAPPPEETPMPGSLLPLVPEGAFWTMSPGLSPSPQTPPSDSGIAEITFNPTSPEGYLVAGGQYIKNETGKKPDAEALLRAQNPVTLPKKGVQILIVHTHGSESFQPDENFAFAHSDTDRTEDTRYNVVRLGDEIAEIFEAKGLTVLHDRNIYDYPTYPGSYSRSLNAITKAIAENPGIAIVIDVHRDAIQTAAGTVYKTVAVAGEEKVAQMMLVVGTNDSGLTHPNWQKNLNFALKLQKNINAAHPTLMRPINLRKERFNQHATTGSMILEIGTSGNTLTEAIAAARLFGETAGDMLKGLVQK